MPRLSMIPLAVLALAPGAACTETGEPESASAVSSQAAARPSGRQCFLPRQVNGFNALDDDTVYVSVGANDYYELELFGPCPDVDWEETIAIRSTGGSTWVCQGLDAELIVPSPLGAQRCPVSRVRKLADAEIRAWREGLRRN